MNVSKPKSVLVLFAALSLACASALAYIPPAQFIIKSMASKRNGVRSVRVSGIVKDSTNRHFKVVTIYDSTLRTMMSQAFDETGIELYGIRKKDEEIPLKLLVLYDPGYWEIVGALKRSGIPVHSSDQDGDDVISLQRWNGSIAWALGLTANATDQKSGASQLWIEKDSFLPVRLVTGDEDVQFTNYRYSQELPYPRTASRASRAGVLQLEEDIQSFQINPPASATKTMENSDTAGSDGYTSAGSSSSLKDLIRAYYAGIR